MSLEKTMDTNNTITNQYLNALPGMIDNEAVWKVLKDRSVEQRDRFLLDRFMSSCSRCFDAIQAGADLDEWHDLAKLAAIEPALAQTAYETAQEVLKAGLTKEMFNL